MNGFQVRSFFFVRCCAPKWIERWVTPFSPLTFQFAFFTVPIEVRCILGGVEVSKRLISMPFDHIAYTGKHLGVAFGKQRIT